MDIDEDRVDEAVLALLWLTLHNDCRAWKGHDWDALNRLCDKGFIYDPINKAKSVMLTEHGLAQSEAAFRRLFSRNE